MSEPTGSEHVPIEPQYLYDDEGSLLEQFPCLQHPQIRKACLVVIGMVVVADFLTVAFHWGAICSSSLKTWIIGKYLVPLISYLAPVFYGPCLCAMAASTQANFRSVDNWDVSEDGLGDFAGGDEAPEYSLQDLSFWRLAFSRPQETAQNVADDTRLAFIIRLWLTLIANFFDSTVLEVVWLGYGAICLSRESWICSKQAPWLYHYTFTQVVIGCVLILLLVIWMLASFWCPGQIGFAANQISDRLSGLDIPIPMKTYGSRGSSAPGQYHASESQPLVTSQNTAATAGGATAQSSALKTTTQASPSSASTTSPAASERRRSTAGSIDITVADLDELGEKYLTDDPFEDDPFADSDENEENEETDEGICGICQAILNSEDARPMKCGHLFHKACLNAFNLKKKCPTCKRKKKKKRSEE